MKTANDTCIALLLSGIFFLLLSTSALAVSLSVVSDKAEVSDNDTFALSILIDDADGVAGASFTLHYPETAVEPAAVPVSTDFFIPVDDNSTAPTPHLVNPWLANTAVPGSIILSGAYINPDPQTGGGGYGPGAQTLFTVHFKMKPAAAPDTYTFSIGATGLCNDAAGWGTDFNKNGQCDDNDTAEEVPILIKAYPIGSAEWQTTTLTDDFEVMAYSIDPQDPPSAQVTLTILDTIYIQNETLTDNATYSATTAIFVGSNVTEGKDPGPVTIKSGANVNLQAKKITLKAGVHAEPGSKLQIIGQ